ncbi:MAG: hypothetical protein IKT44_05275 [Clostridia bacterium]|nr:hypothetical protein [Clostridia bacterium]
MKKFLAFLICVLLILSASACTSFDLQQNDVSTNSNTQIKNHITSCTNELG